MIESARTRLKRFVWLYNENLDKFCVNQILSLLIAHAHAILQPAICKNLTVLTLNKNLSCSDDALEVWYGLKKFRADEKRRSHMQNATDSKLMTNTFLQNKQYFAYSYAS